MYKQSFIAVYLFLIALGNANCQEVNKTLTAKNTLFIELGGAAGIASFNYDRLLFEIGEKISVSGRIGVSSYSDFYKNTTPDLYLPLDIFGLYAFDVHHIELGLGLTFLNYAARDIDDLGLVQFIRITEVLFNPSLGYRFQKPEGGIFLRINCTPFIYGRPIIFSNWGGVSIGYTIKKIQKDSKPLISK